MSRVLRQLLTKSAIAASIGIVSVAACTRTTDRVVEPAGASDASSTTPEATDAGVSPIGPIAHPLEPAEDFRLVRSPEFGLPVEHQGPVSDAPLQGPGLGGAGGGGGLGGVGGLAPGRPVASGGTTY